MKCLATSMILQSLVTIGAIDVVAASSKISCKCLRNFSRHTNLLSKITSYRRRSHSWIIPRSATNFSALVSPTHVISFTLTHVPSHNLNHQP